MMAPLSRSATTQASAETSFGTGGVPAAVTMPQPPSASPPIGLAGTGSGTGGSPACGTSEESTAGGVAHLVRAARSASGAAFGSAVASGHAEQVAGAASMTDGRYQGKRRGRQKRIRESAIVLCRVGDRRPDSGEPRCDWCDGCYWAMPAEPRYAGHAVSLRRRTMGDEVSAGVIAGGEAIRQRGRGKVACATAGAPMLPIHSRLSASTRPVTSAEVRVLGAYAGDRLAAVGIERDDPHLRLDLRLQPVGQPPQHACG